jgi:excisionase family DNA binding protein
VGGCNFVLFILLCRILNGEDAVYLFYIMNEFNKKDEETTFEEMTFEKVPLAIAWLILEVKGLKQAVLQAVRNPEDKRELDGWMNIDGLIDYLPDKPAKATVYGWVSERKIPHHKGGKKLRFLKSEIDAWLSGEKRKSEMELEADAAKYLTQKGRAVKYER